MPRDLGGPASWPSVEIIAMVATDAGCLNWQCSCRHVAWFSPIDDEQCAIAREMIEAWEAGADRPWMVRCMLCARGNESVYPLGVALPLPMPQQPADILDSLPEGRLIA